MADSDTPATTQPDCVASVFLPDPSKKTRTVCGGVGKSYLRDYSTVMLFSYSQIRIADPEDTTRDLLEQVALLSDKARDRLHAGRP